MEPAGSNGWSEAAGYKLLEEIWKITIGQYASRDMV
jgi:hypothetical protein